jgi:hypothetical protein
LHESFPGALERWPGKGWRNRLNSLIDVTIAELRSALDVEKAPRSLEHGRLTEEHVKVVLDVAFGGAMPSPQATARECAKRGTVVSYGFTYRFFKEFDVHNRRRLPGMHVEKAAIFEEWLARYKPQKALPGAAEVRMADQVWSKIEAIVLATGTRKTHAANWRRWSDGVVYCDRFACKTTEVPSDFGTSEQIQGWRSRLRELGILDEFYRITREGYTLAEARCS